MEKRLTDEELAREAQRWENREVTPHEWEDAPEAAPRAAESVAVSIRLPKKLLAILKECARRQGIGYQVLMKRWLDERVRDEYQRLGWARHPVQFSTAPTILMQAATFDARGASGISEEGGLDGLGRLARRLPAVEN